MKTEIRLQIMVFAVVSAAFTVIYITQPVLPLLQDEFSAGMVEVSMTVSMVVLGMALSNLPFGFLADRVPLQPLLLFGGLMVAAGGLFCALTDQLGLLIAGRFVQGLFIPSMTTCVAAHLAKTLPLEKLNTVMGSYISATVLGGMTGRLLGGLIRPPMNWRHALGLVSVFVMAAVFSAYRGLPKTSVASEPVENSPGFGRLLMRWDLFRIYLCGAGSFAVFSSIFNNLPFRLTSQPFGFSTRQTTFLYLVYVVGIFMGPLAGKTANRFGTGSTLLSGTALLAGALVMILFPWVALVISGLICLCAGFFAIHASAVGALNRKLSLGQGRANALYVLFYYTGGWLGITLTGFLYKTMGWWASIAFCLLLLAFPLTAGLFELKRN